jgi:hypothetical protein
LIARVNNVLTEGITADYKKGISYESQYNSWLWHPKGYQFPVPYSTIF